MKKGKLLVKSVNWQALYDLNTGNLLDENRFITDERINEFLEEGETVSVDWVNQAFINHFSFYPNHVSKVVWHDERF